MSLQQYEKKTLDVSKQQLIELLNNILTDMQMKDEEKLSKLQKFKETHPDVYEEKYPTIQKALNILGLNDSISFPMPNHLISKSYLASSDMSMRRESEFYTLKKKTNLAKMITDSAKKRTGFPSSSSITSYLNQTTIMPPSSFPSLSSAKSSMNASIAFPKFFNKRKKENLI